MFLRRFYLYIFKIINVDQGESAQLGKSCLEISQHLFAIYENTLQEKTHEIFFDLQTRGIAITK